MLYVVECYRNLHGCKPYGTSMRAVSMREWRTPISSGRGRIRRSYGDLVRYKGVSRATARDYLLQLPTWVSRRAPIGFLDKAMML